MRSVPPKATSKNQQNPPKTQQKKSPAGRASSSSLRSAPKAAAPPAVNGAGVISALAASAPAKRYRNQSRRGKDFLAQKSRELCNFSAVRRARGALRGLRGRGGAGYEDSEPSSSLHRDVCIPRILPGRRRHRPGEVENHFLLHGFGFWLRREAWAGRTAAPQEEGGIASGVKQADKSPSQVFRFSSRFYLRYDSPRTKKI